MRRYRVSLPIGAILLAVSLVVSASVSQRLTVGVDRHCTNTSEVLQIFMLAVDRDELILFDNVLNRDDISPSRVVLSFDVGKQASVNKVYSDLKKAILLKDHQKFQVNSISVTLNSTGHIIETKAHLVPSNKSENISH